MNSERTIQMAQQVVANADRYPTGLAQIALLLLLDPDSADMQTLFIEAHQQATTVKSMFVGDGLPHPPEETDYYDQSELHQPGAMIGIEPLNGWTLRLFPQQLRKHLVVVGMTGSGKTNLLQLLAMGLAEIDK